MTPTLNRVRRGAVLLVTVFVAAVLGYRYVGRYEWLESVWMVVVTISTVGYSERSETGSSMQLLSIAVILLGVSASVYTIGGFIQLLLEGEVDRALGRRKMTTEISRLNDHVIICGFGRLGQDLANQLALRHVTYVVIDVNPKKCQLPEQSTTLFVMGDATSETVLEEANLATAKALVTALPTDAENVFITLTARNLRSDLQIIAKSEQESSCRKLRQAGANKIVMPHQIGAQHMERMISRPSTADLFELFAEAAHLDMELDELIISENSPLVGKTLAGSDIKKQYDLLVVGIKDSNDTFRFNPSPDQTIAAHDTVLVMGPLANIARLKAYVA